MTVLSKQVPVIHSFRCIHRTRNVWTIELLAAPFYLFSSHLGYYIQWLDLLKRIAKTPSSVFHHWSVATFLKQLSPWPATKVISKNITRGMEKGKLKYAKVGSCSVRNFRLVLVAKRSPGYNSHRAFIKHTTMEAWFIPFGGFVPAFSQAFL